MPDYTVSGDVDSMLRSANDAAIRSAIGVGTTDAPTFLAQTLTGQSLTGTQATSLVDIAATWNTTGTPSAITLNVTDTLSNAASKLLDLQVGGVSRFFVNKDGLVFSPSNGGNGGGAVFGGGVATNAALYTGQYGIRLASDIGVAWSASRNLNAQDTFIYRDAPGILAQRNGVNAQALRVANSVGASPLVDYDRAVFDFKTTTNTLRIGTENGGTYTTARPIDFVTGGVARWQISAAGDLSPSTTNVYDIGSQFGNRPRNAFFSTSCRAPSVYVQYGGAGGLYFGANDSTNGWVGLTARSAGVITIDNFAGTDFGRLQLGGTTSAFPAIKRNGTGIDIVLANDSGYAPLATGSLTSSSSISAAIGSYVMWGGGTSSRMSAPSNGVIQFTNAATTSFTRLELGEADMGIMRGAGTPENIVTAKVGSIYLRTDGGSGSSFYVKESGVSNTGWVAK